MTNREKAAIEYPARIDPRTAFGGVRGCPGDIGYPELPEHECHGDPESCTKCWDLENPDPINDAKMATIETVDISSDDVTKIDESVSQALKEAPTIKDSGDRTKFESGAVRDMRTGKGRFDLVPLEVVCRMYERPDGKSSVLDHILHFQNTNITAHLIKALDRFALDAYGTTEKTAYSTMFLEVAKHFEDGALKYGPDNWKKGIPTWCYIDSAIRHYIKWYRGDMDEFHNRAFVWNLMCCIWEVDYHKTTVEAAEQAEELKSDPDHPCRNCNTGWGSVSSEGSDGCENYCERLAKYMEAKK